jgi:hypothetical protein
MIQAQVGGVTVVGVKLAALILTVVIGKIRLHLNL